MGSIFSISLPSSPLDLTLVILLIVGLGFLYLKAMEHLFKNEEMSQEGKLIWCVFMAILPILAPSVYLAKNQ